MKIYEPNVFSPWSRQPSSPVRLGTCANSREARVVGIVQMLDVNGPRRKLVGKGNKKVRRIVYK